MFIYIDLYCRILGHWAVAKQTTGLRAESWDDPKKGLKGQVIGRSWLLLDSEALSGQMKGK